MNSLTLKPTAGQLDEHVYGLLKTEGPMNRKELVDWTGIARSTLYDSLLRLRIKKRIYCFSERLKLRGRPKVYFDVIQ